MNPTAYVVSIVDAARRLGGEVRSSIEESGYGTRGSYGTPGFRGYGMTWPIALDDRFLVFRVAFKKPVYESELADAMPIGKRSFTRAFGEHRGTKLNGMTVYWHPRLTEAKGERGDGICVAVGNYQSGLSADGRDERGCAHFSLDADGVLCDGLFG